MTEKKGTAKKIEGGSFVLNVHDVPEIVPYKYCGGVVAATLTRLAVHSGR